MPILFSGPPFSFIGVNEIGQEGRFALIGLQKHHPNVGERKTVQFYFLPYFDDTPLIQKTMKRELLVFVKYQMPAAINRSKNVAFIRTWSIHKQLLGITVVLKSNTEVEQL